MRFVKVLLHKQSRESLWWNLKRICVEHMYYDELDLLDKYFGRKDKINAAKLYNQLYKNEYLQAALIRMGAIYSSMHGDE